MAAALESVDDIALFFAGQRRRWNLFRWLAPVPEIAREQKARFFAERTAGRAYDPVMRYPDAAPAELDTDERALRELALPDGPLGTLLGEERQYLLHQIELVRCRGDAEAFTQISRESFGFPSQRHIDDAHEGLRHVPEPLPDRAISAEELRSMALAHLRELGIDDWMVVVDPSLVSIMKIDSGHRLIELRGDFTFGPVDEISLLRHEIEGHVVRAENGWRLGHEFLGLGVGNETELDEGIACYFEHKHGGLCGRRYQELAARVTAVAASATMGFAALYDHIHEVAPEIGDDLTYQLALRVKRGLTDMSLPGGWSKDALYFMGLEKVQDYVREHGEARLHDELMAARVSWEGVAPALELRRQAGR